MKKCFYFFGFAILLTLCVIFYLALRQNDSRLEDYYDHGQDSGLGNIIDPPPPPVIKELKFDLGD